MTRARKTLEQRASKLFVDLYVLEQRAKAIERELAGGSLADASKATTWAVQGASYYAGALLTDIRRRNRLCEQIGMHPSALELVGGAATPSWRRP